MLGLIKEKVIMKNVNPFEICVVKFTDELTATYSFNVFLTDLPKFVREVVKFLGETPLESLNVEFGVDPVKNRDGEVEFWRKFY